MTKTLYQISADFERVLDMCYDETISDEEIQAALAQLEGELTEKVSNGIAVIQQLKATADATNTEIQRLIQHKRAIESRVNFLKNYYLDHLTRIGKTKVLTARGAMTISKAGGLKPIKIDDADLIPTEYKREITTTEIDKDALREALERGDVVSGAHLEPRGNYLRIS